MAEFDRHLWAIGHVQRRRLLLTLLREPQIQLDDLNMSEEQKEMLLVEVKHAHLPKLADGGFIDWVPGNGCVERGPEFEAVEPLLRLLHDHRADLPDGWL
ncbi:ArsR family transcriptional regulator [Natronobeatus ordinarius]|uniref:ArsR family transcriptional regulator n=1 Tax=Natronobeatus ordinarius TaxID=2963433 RepID=UPI0020CC3DF3|nr:ArsR family transcriptional regulator [Natronobeatus ordinarius]